MDGSAESDFDAFYRATATRVVHLVYATTGSLGLAQDSAQEAYARAWADWSRISRADDPLAWVRTVARRHAVSQWRKDQNRRKAYARHGETPALPGPSEDRVAVTTALAQLSAPLREAVALHYVADLSVEQIARETGAPVGTVKARLHRGRKQLAELLATKDAHPSPTRGEDRR